MIRYSIERAELLQKINAASPSWLERAKARLEELAAKGTYDGTKSSFWSEVTPVFRELQSNKCAFCERRLSGPPFGAVEFDLEHFRPKSEVKAWPTGRIRSERKIEYDFATGGDGTGYYLLSYSLFNYAAACKTCNSPLKSSYFPVAASRQEAADDPDDCAREKAFLPFPLGDSADDPARLITFEGILPVPRYKSGEKYRRALVTIDFFELDTREELLRERAAILLGLAGARAHPEDEALDVLRRAALSPRSPHSSCANAYDRLWTQDKVRALKVRSEIMAYLESHS